MKMLYRLSIKNLIGLSLLLCFYSCDEPVKYDYEEIQYLFKNDTDQDVVFLCFRNMVLVDIDYDSSDTTIVNCFRHSSCRVVSARNNLKCNSRYDTFKKMFSGAQFVRVFVSDMNDYYHPREWCKRDSYYVRYDISLEDIQKLINDERELEIHYPPDERMKDIKMWPRYEDVISRE